MSKDVYELGADRTNPILRYGVRCECTETANAVHQDVSLFDVLYFPDVFY
jgi:hypothetical protein